MEELLKILQRFNDSINYESETALLTDGVIDSVDLVELAAMLEESYHIDIPLEEIIPENFDSAADIYQLIKRLTANTGGN